MSVQSIIFLVLLTTLAATPVKAQDKGQQPPPRPVVRVKGWRVPGLDEFSIVSSSEKITIDRVEVLRKVHRVSGGSKPLVELEGFGFGDDGSIVINSAPGHVTGFFSYEARGRTFAYEIRFEPVCVDVIGSGNRRGMCTHYMIIYSDEDGDGRFETRSGSSGDAPKLLRWARR